MLPRPAAFLSPPGSIDSLRSVLHSPPPPAPPTNSGPTSVPYGPQSELVSTPSVASAESNRNSLSSPRHTRLDTRPANDRVSPLTPGAPNAPAGTHTNNPGNPPRIP